MFPEFQCNLIYLYVYLIHFLKCFRTSSAQILHRVIWYIVVSKYWEDTYSVLSSLSQETEDLWSLIWKFCNPMAIKINLNWIELNWTLLSAHILSWWIICITSVERQLNIMSALIAHCRPVPRGCAERSIHGNLWGPGDEGRGEDLPRQGGAQRCQPCQQWHRPSSRWQGETNVTDTLSKLCRHYPRCHIILKVIFSLFAHHMRKWLATLKTLI